MIAIEIEPSNSSADIRKEQINKLLILYYSDWKGKITFTLKNNKTVTAQKIEYMNENVLMFTDMSGESRIVTTDEIFEVKEI